MKIFCSLIVFALLCCGNSKAQDLIVTLKGDSLNCLITQVEENFIHFSLKQGSEQKKILMAKVQIKYYEINYYTKPRLANKKTVVEDDYINPYIPYKRTKLRIAVNGGWSYLTAKLSDNVSTDFNQYYKELRTGYNFNADAEYFFTKLIGMGLSYSIFKTKNTIQPVYAQNTITGQVKVGVLKDDITTQFIGPLFAFRLQTKNKTTVFLPYVSLGYLWYKNNATLIDDYIIEGNTVGRKFGFNLEFMFDADFSFGIDASYTSGVLTEFTIESNNVKAPVKLKSDEYANISRLDLSAGIRYSF